MSELSVEFGDQYPDELAGDEVQDDLGLNYTAFEDEGGGDE